MHLKIDLQLLISQLGVNEMMPRNCTYSTNFLLAELWFTIMGQ